MKRKKAKEPGRVVIHQPRRSWPALAVIQRDHLVSIHTYDEDTREQLVERLNRPAGQSVIEVDVVEQTDLGKIHKRRRDANKPSED